MKFFDENQNDIKFSYIVDMTYFEYDGVLSI